MKHDGLTEKQAAACQRLLIRILKAHEELDLQCQWFMSESEFAADQIADAAVDAMLETKH